MLTTTYFEPETNGDPHTVYTPNYFNPPTGDSSDWKITYTYNELGELIEKNAPADDGTIKNKYDNLGNLRFSESARQRANTQFSYFGYDFNNRLIYSGEVGRVFDLYHPDYHHIVGRLNHKFTRG